MTTEWDRADAVEFVALMRSNDCIPTATSIIESAIAKIDSQALRITALEAENADLRAVAQRHDEELASVSEAIEGTLYGDAATMLRESPGVPEGWQLVPKEGAWSMTQAAMHALANRGPGLTVADVGNAIAAALASAPQREPPGVPNGLTQNELQALIDYHECLESDAESVGANRCATYNRERSEHWRAVLKVATPRAEPEGETK